MNKKSVILIFLIFTVSISQAQTWDYQEGFDDGDLSDFQCISDYKDGNPCDASQVSLDSNQVFEGTYSITLEHNGGDNTQGYGTVNVPDGNWTHIQFASYVENFDDNFIAFETNQSGNRFTLLHGEDGNGEVRAVTPSQDIRLGSGMSTNTWYIYDLKYDYTNEVYNITVSDSSGTYLFSQNIDALKSNGFPDFDGYHFNVYGGDNQVNNWDEINISTDSNTPPQFNSTTVSPDPITDGSSVDYSAEVYDSDGSIDYTNLTVEKNGTVISSDLKRTGSTPSWTGVYIAEGDYNYTATFETVDDAGAVTTTTLERYVEPSDDVVISETNITVNKTSNESFKPSPWIERPKALIENFDGSTDSAWVTVYNDDGSLDYNQTLYSGSSAVDGEIYNYTTLSDNTIREIKANRTYNFTVYDDSASKQFFSVEYRYVENNVVPSISYGASFNHSTIEIGDSFDVSNEFYNWHQYTNAYNSTYDLDFREEGNTGWNDGIEVDYTNYNGSSYVTAGEYITQVNTSSSTLNDLQNLIDDDVNITFRHSTRYYNASTGNQVNQITEYTYHRTSSVDTTLFNTFTKALEPVENLISNLINYVVTVVVDIISFVLDSIITFLVAVVNVLTYIISAVIETLRWIFMYVINYNLQLQLYNIETNETINLDNNSESITTAFDDGYRIRNNQTIAEWIDNNSGGLTDSLTNLQPVTIYSYDYRSSIFNKSTVETFNYSSFNIANFTGVGASITEGTTGHLEQWNGIKISNTGRIRYEKDLSLTEEKNFINTTHYFDLDAADSSSGRDGYAIFLETEKESNYVSTQIGSNDAKSEMELYPDTYITRINDTHVFIDSEIRFNWSTGSGYATNTDYVNGSVPLNESQDFKLQYGTVSNGQSDTQEFAWVNYTTNLRIDGLSKPEQDSISIAWFKNPKSYPDGYPIGTITVISALTGLVGFILALMPNVFINAVKAFVGTVSTLVNGIFNTIGMTYDLFRWVFIDGIGYVVLFAKMFIIFKAVRYGKLAYKGFSNDHALSINDAINEIMDDAKDQILTTERLARESMDITMQTVRTFISILRAIRDLIKFW